MHADELDASITRTRAEVQRQGEALRRLLADSRAMRGDAQRRLDWSRRDSPWSGLPR